ncbi:MAG: hypothetical protein ACI9T8_000163 [Candidatus Saccharimonadales bacterium]|jgi:hypothetical protein
MFSLIFLSDGSKIEVMNKLLSQYEISTNGIDHAFDHNPKRSIDRIEAARRSGRPRGMLLAEQQQSGAQMLLMMLQNASRSGDIDTFRQTKEFAIGALWNSARYMVEHGSRMRRNLEMGSLGLGKFKSRESALDTAFFSLGQATSRRLRIIEHAPHIITPHRLQYAKNLASAAIALEAHDMVGTAVIPSAEMQDGFRRQLLTSDQAALVSHVEMGSTTSLVNLADYGLAGQHMMRVGTPALQGLYQEAIEEYALVA